MIKSFLRLLLLVVTPLLLLLFAQGPYNPITVASNYFDEKYLLKLFDGPLRLIEIEMVAVKPEVRQRRFEEIAGVFGTRLELKRISEMDLSYLERQRLSSGGSTLLFNPPLRLARVVKASNDVIIMSVNELEDQQAYRQASGPFYLLSKYVQRYPQEHWPNVVEGLQNESAVGLSLVDATLLEHEGEITNSFSKGKLSWFEYDGKNESFFYLVGDSKKSLKLGPIPSEKRILTSRYILSASMVLIALAVVVFFWLWPLWQNIKRLKTSAMEFGKGKLETRVIVDRGSIVSELGVSFNNMADRIQKLVTVNQDLANSVAHDLRTPLARIRFAQEILDSGDCTDKEAIAFKQSIEFSINSLDHMINQTLTHSRYNRLADIRNFTDCQFAKVIQEEVAQTAISHPELSFDLHISKDVKSRLQFVVKGALRRALMNLLGNAVKYAESQIKVSFSSIEAESREAPVEYFALVVEDDGVGVPEEQREKVLEPFVQLNCDEANQNLGQGLGLAIVKQVAGWHEGEVRLEESSMGGARVKLVWPCLVNPSVDNDRDQSVQILTGG